VRRGVSGLIAVLVLGLVMVSLISTAVTLSSRLQRGVEESSSRASRILSEASQPPVLSLYSSNGALYVEVVTSRPLEIRGFIVELPNSFSFKPVGNTTIGVSRFKVVDSYNCEPVRVHVLLASGLVISYDPRLDPRIGFTPRGWDGWWRCGIAEGTGGSGGVYDPRVWLEARGLGGGGNDTITIPVNWQHGISAWVRVGASAFPDGYTWGKCEVGRKWEYFDWGSWRWVTVWEWAPELVIGSFTVSNSRVDVVLGCAEGWPIALYLALRGLDDVVFSGRVDFSYRVTYRTHDPPRDMSSDPSLDGPLPVAYTPMGSSSYYARRSWGASRVEWIYEGSATINYRMSTVMVLLAWAYMRPDPFIGDYNSRNPYVNFSVGVSIRVVNATRVSLNPVSLDLGVTDAVRIRLYKYNLTSPTITRDYEPLIVREQFTLCSPVYKEWVIIASIECRPAEKVYMTAGRVSVPEPFSYAVYKVYQSLLPGAPRVHVVASVNGVEFRRSVEPGRVAEVAFPGARFRVEATPYAHPPLFNGISTSYRDVSDRVREYSGGTHPAPSLSPWRGPALVEVELPKSRFLAALSWPGVLTVTQANTTYRGYAQLIGDKPYAITPSVSYRVVKAQVDSRSLVVTVEQTIDPRSGWIADLRTLTGTYIVITITPRNSYETESIIAWVS
jgi:hypothetical protein